MESADSSPTPVTPMAIAAFVNREVFEQLTAKSNDPQSGVVAPKNFKEMLSEDAANVHRDEGFTNLYIELRGAIRGFYRSCSVSDAVVIAVAKSVASKTKEEFGVKLSREFDRLMIAFTQTKYVGDAQNKFEEYLWRCWKAYNPQKYKAPYVAVVQSSGFGKSRMLFELARKAEHAKSQMKVLYTCVRLHESTGYPEVTPKLRDWLFPSRPTTADDMISRLINIYDYAIANWENVQTEWIELFTDPTADDNVHKKLTQVDLPSKRPAKQSIRKNPNGKMVVLVVDEAMTLLAERKTRSTNNNFRMLRQALELANYKIGTEGGIFGVLIDTNLTISDTTPPLSLDPSSRSYEGKTLASFPPFVLTHTMDANWREYCQQVNPKAAYGDDEEQKDEGHQVTGSAQVSDQKQKKMDAEIAVYKAVVTGGEDRAWDALKRMGRPMWWSTFNEASTSTNVVDLAANRLLLGLSPDVNTYTENTMFGVASMLCRIGVRLYSTSALASRAVADFMAILVYVNYEREGYLSSYASDPVLALGAMKVWHELDDALPKYILPQLKKLILDEALDTGGVGEMVARIVLLLAMDKCVMAGKRITDYERTAQFVSVEAFLTELEGGGKPTIFRKGMNATNEDMPAFVKWRSQWKDWQMGFTHFVQLQLQPNEDTLWFLLGHRAAGISPRNQKGADLLIPIFWKRPADGSVMKTDDKVMAMEEKVSLMLIQVKSKSPTDSEFSRSASMKLCPWFVFGDQTPSGELAENPLSKKSVHEVIRIYLNLRDEVVRTRERDCYNFIYSTSMTDNTPKPENSEAESGKIANEDSNPSDKAKAQGAPAKDDVRMGESNASSKAKLNSLQREAKRPRRDKGSAGSANVDVQLEDENVFTYCFRSLCYATYPFLTHEVAKSLESIVTSLWDPIALVDGDLEYRRTVELPLKAAASKGILSEVMPDGELKCIASQGFV